MKIIDIAEKCDYEIFGCNKLEVNNISYAKEAEEDSIAIAYSKKDILNTKAKVVVTEPKFVNTDKTLILVHDSIEAALVKIANLMIEKGYYKDYSKPVELELNNQNYVVGKKLSIGENTSIGPFSVIEDDVVIGKECIIESNVTIKSGTIIGDNVHIGSGSIIGANSFYHYYGSCLKSFVGVGRVIIGNYVDIGYNTNVQRGTISNTEIYDNTEIGNLIDIGHDVKIGSGCKIVSQTGIAGNVNIGNNVLILGQVGINNDIVIGNDVIVKGKSRITKNIQSGSIVSGMYSRNHKEELRIQAKLYRL
ncbi:hypothetical protein ACQPV1_18485 [Clostridium neonatale]|uniref:hypothetical protein n=1 Tax=Clostridium neonatale TaxID=137838 RepID=UPI003D3494E8